MGCACLVPNKKSAKEQLPQSAKKYLDQQEKLYKKDSVFSANTNPEQLLRKSSQQSCKKREESPTASSDTKPPESPSSFITLSQLMQEQKEGNRPQEPSYKSSIIRLPKRQKRESQEDKAEKAQRPQHKILSQIQCEQKLGAKMSQLDDYAKQSKRLQKMDFQFILDNSRAGPLVVPHVVYSIYQICNI